MMSHATPPMPARRRRRFSIKPFLRFLEPIFSVVLAALITGAVLYGLRAIYDRYLRHYTIAIAAGSPTGESFLISRALEAVLEQRLSNVDVRVDATDGTEANLNRLETGEAQLAAAQADIISDYSDNIQTSQARTVAALYEDKFQLLVCDPAITDFPAFLQRLRDTSSIEMVYVPLQGGQRLSFLHVAEHFGLRDTRHYAFADEGARPAPCNPGAYNTIIFRVRLAGNQEVASYLNEGWRLLPLAQVEAMRLKNAALQPAVIPAGTYAGAAPGAEIVPVPAGNLDTIGVQRLLLVRADVPDWIVYEMANILNQSSQELALGLLSYSYELTSAEPDSPYRRYVEDFVVPLVPNIAAQNDGIATTAGVPLHPGAYQFYRPNESWFTWLNDNADGIGLGITAVTIGGSLLLGLSRSIQRGRKDTADSYLKEMAYLKNPGRVGLAAGADEETARMRQRLAAQLRAYESWQTSIRVEQLPPDNDELDRQLLAELIDGICRAERLRDVFDEASQALEQDQISEESFRTFTEAHKTTREAIEQRSEEIRRSIALYYVNQTMKLLDPARERVATMEHLDFIRAEASRVLTNELIFSRESFRTFIDAYTLAKETVAARRVADTVRR